MTDDIVWLHVTSGRGPGECQLAVGHLVPVIEQAAQGVGLTATVLEAERGDGRGQLRSGLLKITGAGADPWSLTWRGSVLWIAPSPLRPGHKRKNWFVGVERLAPPAERVGAPVLTDVTIETMRASGPGGQHVNRTESAVRAIHRPTGLVATAREERSQAMNRRLALARLAQLIETQHRAGVADVDRRRWQQHDDLERGNPVRVFVGPDFVEKKLR